MILVNSFLYKNSTQVKMYVKVNFDEVMCELRFMNTFKMTLYTLTMEMHIIVQDVHPCLRIIHKIGIYNGLLINWFKMFFGFLTLIHNCFLFLRKKNYRLSNI